MYSRHHTVNIIELAVNTVNTRRSHDFNVDPDVREIRVREFLDDNFSTTSFEQMIQIRVHQALGRTGGVRVAHWKVDAVLAQKIHLSNSFVAADNP